MSVTRFPNGLTTSAKNAVWGDTPNFTIEPWNWRLFNLYGPVWASDTVRGNGLLVTGVATSGDAAIYSESSTGEYAGAFSVETGATANDRSLVFPASLAAGTTKGNMAISLRAVNEWVIATRVGVYDVSATDFQCGLLSTALTDVDLAAPNGACLVQTGSNWYFRIGNGSGAAAAVDVDLGVAADGVFHDFMAWKKGARLRIYKNGLKQHDTSYADWSDTGGAAAGWYSSQTGPGIIVKTLAGAAAYSTHNYLTIACKGFGT